MVTYSMGMPKRLARQKLVLELTCTTIDRKGVRNNRLEIHSRNSVEGRHTSKAESQLTSINCLVFLQNNDQYWVVTKSWILRFFLLCCFLFSQSTSPTNDVVLGVLRGSNIQRKR